MVEVKYPCPQCKASLKLKSAVPAGKKIKCPKCEAVFAPVEEPARAALEDNGVGTFGFKEEAPPAPRKVALTDDDEDDEELKERSDGRLDRKFPRSKRGPAQAIIMKPSNKLLATASFVCASCILSVIVAMWPMVFSLKTELTGGQILERWIAVGLCVLSFVYNGAITYGAVKMQSVESYSSAMMASVMMLLPFNWILGSAAFFWLTIFLETVAGPEFKWATWLILTVWFVLVGYWNMNTLRMPEVIAGFQEKPEEY